MVDGESGGFPKRPFLLNGTGDTYNSACHGWSGWISYVLSAWLVGVRPVEPGFARTVVRPLAGGPDRMRATVPTPHGPLRVTIREERESWQVELDTPSKVRLECDMSHLEAAGKPVVQRVHER
jgi:hypothetical protein